MHLGL